MRIKSYFADSVQEAIEKARVELGPDAMLMNSKKTDFELRALGSFEVVFGVPGQNIVSKGRLQLKNASPQIAEPAPAETAVADKAAKLSLSGEVTQELAELRRQIETVRLSMNRQQRAIAGTEERHTRTSENHCARLISAGISEDLAQEISEAAELQAFAWKQSPSKSLRDFEMVPSETLELALAAEMERRLQVSAELGKSSSNQKVVMFVGPAGAGKTTSLIKLALRYGLQSRVPMHILSLDTLRVGGWEHLAAYSRIAGLGFDAVHSLSNLELLLAQHADKKLIMIDTPGFGPAEAEDLNDLASWARRYPGVDIQLVLPAILRSSVITRTLERFSVFPSSKLLLTRADELDLPGILVDIAMRAQLPLSYISNGQTVPEDIAQATKSDLLACITAPKPARAKQEAA